VKKNWSNVVVSSSSTQPVTSIKIVLKTLSGVNCYELLATWAP